MTQLAEILQSAGETIFQVTFRKQPTFEHAANIISQLSVNDLKE